MILILTQPLDEHADYLTQKLGERGADFVRFNPAQFPSQAQVFLSYSLKGHICCTLRVGKESINLNKLKAVWYRRPQHPVPHEEISDKLSREKLGLCYGAIDMVLTPDGRYVFLEINPNGQYLWIEFATGLPISDAICDLLISGSPMSKPAEYLLASHSGGFR